MATKSVKTKFDYGNAATYADSTTFTPFANVLEIKPPGLTSDDIETTNLDTQDEMKDFDPGLGDAGESTFKIQWDADQTATVYSLFRQKKGFRIVYADAPYPSGSKLRFNGWIKGIAGETIQKDNVVEAEITVRVVGLPDFDGI
jgi:hypothetical protein